MSLQPIVEVYRWLLQPTAPFTWLGYDISTLDLAAALRLCVVLRQLRDGMLESHLKASGLKKSDVETRSLVKSMSTTLVVVYGGEAVVCPWLQKTPSFMYSPVVPALYSALTAFVEHLPWLPEMSLMTELPLSVLDGFSRSFLLCQLIPPAVLSLSSSELATSPWTLLISSLFIANSGFFITNLFSMLHPTGYSISTPPELRAYGWTTTDLWCAPFITGLYALLTHAQPFWADMHGLIVAWTSGAADFGDLEKGSAGVVPMDSETARAACALVLMTMFVSRTVKGFGAAYLKELNGGSDYKKPVAKSRMTEKTKTQ